MTALESALLYAERGWQVFPLASGSKIPRAGFSWPAEASNDPEKIAAWSADGLLENLAVVAGQESNIVIVDVDAGEGKLGQQNWDIICEVHGYEASTLQARTPNGGRHYFYKFPAERVPNRTNALGTHIDIRSAGGYALVAPSVGGNGNAYEWINPDAALEEMPDWMLIMASRSTAALAAAPQGVLLEDEAAELRSALSFISADERDVRLRVGMALHSTLAGEQAYILWEDWLKTSDRYDEFNNRRTWDGFKPRADGVGLGSIFEMARACHWTPADVVSPLDQIDLSRVVTPEDMQMPPMPQELIDKAPGKIGELTRWIDSTSIQKQPGFALMTACAIVSAAAGRRYYADLAGNFTSLYFLMIGRTGCGKDHGRKAIRAAFEQSGYGDLVTDRFASDSAVFEALLEQPTQISVMDEFGLLMTNSQKAGQSWSAKTFDVIMQLFGQLDSSAKTPAKATKRDGSSTTALRIERPALTIYGMSTPGTLADALTSRDATSGFLSRFLVYHTHLPPKSVKLRGRKFTPLDPGEDITAWLSDLRSQAVPEDLAPPPEGNLVPVVYTLPEPAEPAPPAHPVHVTDDAAIIFDDFEDRCHEQREELEEIGLADLMNRTREKAIRLGTIAAVAVNHTHPRITAMHAQWACDLAWHCDAGLVRMIKANVADSQAAKDNAEVLQTVIASGKTGIAKRLLYDSQVGRRLSNRKIDAALDYWEAAGRIEEKHAARKGPGRPPKRLYAVEPDDSEE